MRVFDEAQAIADHKLAVEEIASQERVARFKLSQETEIAKIKVKAQNQRHLRERVVMGLIRLPILPLTITAVTALVLFKREVPKPLLDLTTL